MAPSSAMNEERKDSVRITRVYNGRKDSEDGSKERHFGIAK